MRRRRKEELLQHFFWCPGDLKKRLLLWLEAVSPLPLLLYCLPCLLLLERKIRRRTGRMQSKCEVETSLERLTNIFHIFFFPCKKKKLNVSNINLLTYFLSVNSCNMVNLSLFCTFQSSVICHILHTLLTTSPMDTRRTTGSSFYVLSLSRVSCHSKRRSTRL